VTGSPVYWLLPQARKTWRRSDREDGEEMGMEGIGGLGFVITLSLYV
jgi:hypothetical protein